MTDLKWVVVGGLIVFLSMFAALLVANTLSTAREINSLRECVENGGQWVTNSVAGNPTNHDCVRP